MPDKNNSEIEQAYRAHAGTVYKFLLAQCRDPQLAEELTQETFYQAVQSIHQYDGSCKLSVWLCQIAKHLWYHHLRRCGKETPTAEPWLAAAELPVQPSPEQQFSARQQHLQLLRSIQVLPPPAREVVYLRVFGELSFAEIADVMGKTETWARVTFYRSKEKLKQTRGGENA
ncbi:MAG: sigma-70 family RNA polymerase sigma factor [Faecalibacterium sp.]|nr:sigma-70 family RNA polymerase sigma factor [Faecalibacterium sp.]